VGKESDWVELAFLTLLLKDGADSISRGVAVDHKGVVETRLVEDGGRANGIDKGLKSGFVFVFPMESTPLGTKCDKRVKRGG
jgi:hypothetical protein